MCTQINNSCRDDFSLCLRKDIPFSDSFRKEVSHSSINSVFVLCFLFFCFSQNLCMQFVQRPLSRVESVVAIPHESLGHMSVVSSIRAEGFTTVSSISFCFFPHSFVFLTVLCPLLTLYKGMSVLGTGVSCFFENILPRPTREP